MGIRDQAGLLDEADTNDIAHPTNGILHDVMRPYLL